MGYETHETYEASNMETSETSKQMTYDTGSMEHEGMKET
jgi:hypothetical protein